MTQDSALTPKQARSRESQRRILAATLALLDHSHFEAITIAQIAAEAGMAVGNFYKRFKNKEALLPHLYDEYNRRFAVFAQALQASSSKNPWRLIVQRTVVFFSENKGLIRALHLHSRLNPDVVPHGSSQAREKLYRAFEPLVTKRGLSARSRSVRARTVAARDGGIDHRGDTLPRYDTGCRESAGRKLVSQRAHHSASRLLRVDNSL